MTSQSLLQYVKAISLVVTIRCPDSELSPSRQWLLRDLPNYNNFNIKTVMNVEGNVK